MESIHNCNSYDMEIILPGRVFSLWLWNTRFLFKRIFIFMYTKPDKMSDFSIITLRVIFYFYTFFYLHPSTFMWYAGFIDHCKNCYWRLSLLQAREFFFDICMKSYMYIFRELCKILLEESDNQYFTMASTNTLLYIHKKKAEEKNFALSHLQWE